MEVGKVTAVYGKHIRVYYEGKEYAAVIRGKILKDQLSSSPVAAGDNVEMTFERDQIVAIEKVLPRTQYLARPEILSSARKQIIAANLDQLVIVCSVQHPPFRASLVDRFLVSAEKENLKAVIVINKIDLSPADNYRPYQQTWQALSYDVLFTSAKERIGLDAFRDSLKDRTSALAGHSGVGKSSLLNALQPSLNLKTRRISQASGKGVHTTSSVILYHLDFGGWVADTPGLKVFGLAGIDKKNLYRYFPEFLDKIDSCRFTDCQHIREPDCAVKNAVDAGGISYGRYQSYVKLWEQLSG